MVLAGAVAGSLSIATSVVGAAATLNGKYRSIYCINPNWQEAGHFPHPEADFVLFFCGDRAYLINKRHGS